MEVSIIMMMMKIALFNKIYESNREDRNLSNIERRMMKLIEEIGESFQAYLSVTSEENLKDKTWYDFREELIDSLIILTDILYTSLPSDVLNTKEYIEDKCEEIADKKLKKWINLLNNKTHTTIKKTV